MSLEKLIHIINQISRKDSVSGICNLSKQHLLNFSNLITI